MTCWSKNTPDHSGTEAYHGLRFVSSPADGLHPLTRGRLTCGSRRTGSTRRISNRTKVGLCPNHCHTRQPPKFLHLYFYRHRVNPDDGGGADGSPRARRGVADMNKVYLDNVRSGSKMENLSRAETRERLENWHHIVVGQPVAQDSQRTRQRLSDDERTACRERSPAHRGDKRDGLQDAARTSAHRASAASCVGTPATRRRDFPRT